MFVGSLLGTCSVIKFIFLCMYQFQFFPIIFTSSSSFSPQILRLNVSVFVTMSQVTVEEIENEEDERVSERKIPKSVYFILSNIFFDRFSSGGIFGEVFIHFGKLFWKFQWNLIFFLVKAEAKIFQFLKARIKSFRLNQL